MRAMTLRPWGDHPRHHDIARGGLDDERFVFARPVRWFVACYVGMTALACALLAPTAMNGRAYMEALVLVSAVCWAPGTFIAWHAARNAPRRDRLVWRLWVAGFVFGWVSMVRVVRLDDAAWDAIQRHAVGAAVTGVLILVVANTLILRSRSGQRTVLIDIADIVMAIAAIVAPLVLLVGEPIVTADARWFTVSSAVWFLGALYSTAVAIVLHLRVRPEDRSVARYGVAFGAVVLVSTSAQAFLGVGDFRARPGPYLAAHALCAGFTVVFLVHSTRRSSTGLERFPARDQVRRPPVITVLVLATIPVTGLLVWARRDEDWAVGVALAAAGVLVVLFCIRSLLAARETRHLYRGVERSADERGELLTDVLAHAEADRHRAAAYLHRQSVQLYTALSSASGSIGPDTGRATPAARVTERLRDDLGRQSDELARFALAVRPGPGRPAASFATPLRVQIDGLFPEDRRPRLEAGIDPDLVLAWTDEAVLARIAEDALGVLAARMCDPTQVRLDLRAIGGDLVLAIELDGAVRDVRPEASAASVPSGGRGAHASMVPLDDQGPELAPIRAGAELLGGRMAVTGGAGRAGVVIRVPLAPAPTVRPSPTRPDLRLVD